MAGMYYLYYQNWVRFCTVAVKKLGAAQKHSHFYSHSCTTVIPESHPWVKHCLSQTWLHPQRRKSYPNYENPPKRVPSLPGIGCLVYFLYLTRSWWKQCSLGLRWALGRLWMAGQTSQQAKMAQCGLQVSSSTALGMDCLSTCLCKQRLMMAEETKTSKTQKTKKTPNTPPPEKFICILCNT